VFQPREVKEAQAWLNQGNPRQAAYALLAARDPNHKDVVACRQRVAEVLLETARREYEDGALLASFEAIQLAKKLAPLNKQDAVFAEKVEREWEREKGRQQAIHYVEKQAQQWLQQRRYRSVIDLIKHFLEGMTGVQREDAANRLLPLLADARARLNRVEALLQEAEQSLERNDLAAAEQALNGVAELVAADDYRYKNLRNCLEEKNRKQMLDWLIGQTRRAIQAQDLPRAIALWHKACEHDPDNEEVRQLAYEVHKLEQRCREQRVCVRITERNQRFVVGNRWLIVSASEIVLGVGEQATIRLLARLHGCHARLLRDHGRYQLVPCLDKHGRYCYASVNGRAVSNAHPLRDGDEIALGDAGATSVIFRFRQTVPGSGTAVLIAPAAEGRILAPARISQVVLLDESVTFTPQAGQGHVYWPDLPCCLKLVWSHEGLLWQTEGGEALLDSTTGEPIRCRSGQVFVPSRLTLRADEDMELSEAEVLRRCFERKQQSLVVEFTPAE
jgi:molybdopterin converting factor small subunit